ncbi:hypothetical protein X975_07465, partial [Stegodyphus mimosarum]
MLNVSYLNLGQLQNKLMQKLEHCVSSWYEVKFYLHIW